VLFYVLFVCKCVLYYCYRVSTQLQLTNISYHISYHIISNAKFNGVFSAPNLIVNKLALLWIKHVRMSLMCLLLSIVFVHY